MNNKWKEVIKLAEEYGFIHYCYGGVAILMTPEEQKKLKEENK